MKYIIRYKLESKKNETIIRHIERSGATLIKDLKYKQYDYHDKRNIYVIEAENDAIHILKGKGYHPRRMFE